MHHGGRKLAFGLLSRTLTTTFRATLSTNLTSTSVSVLKESHTNWTVRTPTGFSGFTRRPIPLILSEVCYPRRRCRFSLPATVTVDPKLPLRRTAMSPTASKSAQRTETNASTPLPSREEVSKDNASMLVNRMQLSRRVIEVDVIVPVHNAAETIISTVESAMTQIIPDELDFFTKTDTPPVLSIHVCCYDDGSTDDSWKLLTELLQQQQPVVDETSTTTTTENAPSTAVRRIPTTLHIAQSVDGVGRGAGYARNRAVEMRSNQLNTNNDSESSLSNYQQLQQAPAVAASAGDCFLCMLDSDDVMHPTRVAHQVAHLLSLSEQERQRTLLGCTFDRDPPDATWHYAQWANGLSDASLMHEQYRELTLLQPTWMLTRSRFESLQGYMEAPPPNDTRTIQEYFIDQKYNDNGNNSNSNHTNNGDADEKDHHQENIMHLVHADFETMATLRVAEDLRFWHKHLAADQGLLQLVRTVTPLLTYKHREGQSQSSQTPRRLLLYLRVRALERRVLQADPAWQQFCVWGAGRDGKDFVKALSPETRRRVYCMVDVDDKKIDRGYYVNRDIDVKIPIIHYSLLAKDPAVRLELRSAFEEGTGDTNNEPGFGKIDKGKSAKASSSAADSNGKPEQEAVPPPKKKRRLHTTAPGVLDLAILPELPVVVCVAMYRTNGALEHNVKSIGRTEGKDLWHFS